jgi:AAA domain
VTLIGGLAGHGKTLLMLAMAKALLEELPLFGYQPFSVQRPAQRVLYLIPESSLGPFSSRIQLCQLREHISSDRLLVRTLSSREQVSLDDPRLLKAAEGADVFLDTAVRFMDGSENDVEKKRARLRSILVVRLVCIGSPTVGNEHRCVIWRFWHHWPSARCWWCERDQLPDRSEDKQGDS